VRAEQAPRRSSAAELEHVEGQLLAEGGNLEGHQRLAALVPHFLAGHAGVVPRQLVFAYRAPRRVAPHFEPPEDGAMAAGHDGAGEVHQAHAGLRVVVAEETRDPHVSVVRVRPFAFVGDFALAALLHARFVARAARA